MNNPLEKLNPRERGLLMATAAVFALGGLLFAGRAGMATVHDLDDRIANREVEIESLTQLNVQADSVNAAYSRVVTQHSSASTVSEIHDNLRREIMRLTQVDFPAKDGKPARTMPLVNIPALDEGQLTQGKGHRDYQIRFQIPNARLEFLLSFLERLEESKQLLRIDNLDIGREPDSSGVAATLQITRTVLDNPEAVQALSEGDAK